ncbi:hypothetical protein [Erythrobacter sp. HL-111]|uniref:hypothetical protein n=1 Tax=Erythrobacter sp. HL-111 TaxID=1798193 RepID=UPI0006D9E4A3|nr:hypothetical protein [Erythrobacter sp. HL-111]KPP94047.1 MAG: hypothetical protein HLUCCO15_04840 [Erythrobacteraceae bacterium HL-111]SDS59468.1 hypothetical protein SAMN04515621_1852 [Erythrobacter sp. HL-111]
MNPRLSLLLVSALIAPTPGPAAAQQKQSFDFEIGDTNGICSVGIPAGDQGLKLEFTIRVSDANVNVSMHNIDGDIVNAGLDAGRKPALALVFDGQRRHDLEWGEYVAGFTYRAVGGWDDAAKADRALGELRTSDAVTFVADRESWGPVSLQARGMAYGLLDDCIQRTAAKQAAEAGPAQGFTIQNALAEYDNGANSGTTPLARGEKSMCFAHWIALLTMHDNNRDSPFWSNLSHDLGPESAEAMAQDWAISLRQDIGDDEQAAASVQRDLEARSDAAFERIKAAQRPEEFQQFFRTLGTCAF